MSSSVSNIEEEKDFTKTSPFVFPFCILVSSFVFSLALCVVFILSLFVCLLFSLQNHSMSQLTVYYILAVQFRTHSVGEKGNF